MQNIQVLRYMATLESKLNSLTSNPSSGVVDLTEINNRLSSLENRLKALEDNKSTNLDMNNELVNLTEINNRVVSLESANLTDVNNHITILENSLSTLENNFNNLNLNDLINRLQALETSSASSTCPMVDLTEINNRLQAIETANNDLSVRLSAIETKPDLLQRLSALELTVATLNNNNNS